MISQQNIDALRAVHNVEVNPHDRALTREELLKAVRGRDAVITLLTDTVDAEVLDAAGPQCRIGPGHQRTRGATAGSQPLMGWTAVARA
jgi:glyoxylate reductase